MLFLISDASVLIDIEKSKLTHAMFRLPYKFIAPDILFYEELAKDHGQLIQSGLISKKMDGELIAKAYKLRQEYIRTSVNDLLALVLAKNQNGYLLTGDKALRDVAKIIDVEVHGTIWLVEEMISHGYITFRIAKSAFEKMRKAGSRLPWKEVEVMLKKYC